MKIFVVVVGLFSLAVLSSAQVETSECPKEMVDTVKAAFEACRPNNTESHPTKQEMESTGNCLMEKFEANDDLKKLADACTEVEKDGRKPIGCIMDAANKLCPGALPKKPRGGPGGPGGPPTEDDE